MLAYRLSVAFLCALLVGGATVGTVPACARKSASQRPACCRNEAACPMHQKQSSGVLGFNTCHGDAADSTTVMTSHRAVLTASVSTIAVPRDDRRFETTVQLPTWFSRVPLTPPPRLG